MTKFGYIRISTLSQQDNFSIANQEKNLLEVGIEKENIFVDIFSGTELNRPELQKLLKKVSNGDEIYVVRLDRFARNTIQALNTIAELEKQGVTLISLDFPHTTDKSMRDFFRTIILFFAQFENEQRKKRQVEGISRAKELGKYKGRKKIITPELKIKLKKLLHERNYTKQDAANSLNISRSTLYKALGELKNE